MLASLAYLSGLSTLLPLSYGFTIRFKVRPFFSRFLVLLLISLLTEIISFSLLMADMPNTPVYNVYGVLFLPLFFYAWIKVTHGNNTIRLIELICLTIGALGILLWYLYQPVEKFNNMSIVARGLVMILVSLTYLTDLAFYSRVQILHREPMFFIMVGMLIYYATTVSLFTSFNFLPADSIKALWPIKLWALVGFNVLVAFAFYIEQKHSHG